MIDPNIITGTLPTLSVSFPLNGREIPAINVNNAMINPLYCAPPRWVIYAGNSGIIMVKLAENKKLLTQSKLNCTVNNGALIAGDD